MFSLVFLCYKVPIPSAAHAAPVLCWPQTFNELSRSRITLASTPLPFRKRVQKYYLFPNWQALFSIIFHLFFIPLIHRDIKMPLFSQFPDFTGQIRQKKGVSGYQ